MDNEIIESQKENLSNKKLKDKFIFIGVFVLLAFAIFLLLYLVLTVPTEATKCLADPILYVQEKTDSFCSCSYQISKFLD